MAWVCLGACFRLPAGIAGPIAAEVSGIAVCLSTLRQGWLSNCWQGQRCSIVVCTLPGQLAVLYMFELYVPRGKASITLGFL